MRRRNQKQSNKVRVLSKTQKVNFKRQKEIFDPQVSQVQKNITIVGLGSIGSHVALALTRLGLKNLTLWDFDKVEEHNIPSQSYCLKDVGKFKATRLKQHLENINSNAKIISVNQKYSASFLSKNEILIIAVDSMEERKNIYNDMKHLYSQTQDLMIIDGRVGGAQLEVYTCRNLKEWQGTFSDNPDTDPCGARYICYISMVVGAFIANQIKRFLKGEPYKKRILFNIDSLQLI